jgi:UDP-N-acetylglucosamine 2-epimerase (non-hydrolysing)
LSLQHITLKVIAYGTNMKKLMFLFGTRPEAIKLAPLIRAFKTLGETYQTVVCVTAQHREMLDQVLEFFQIKPDIDLDLMESAQSLSKLSSKLLVSLEKVLEKEKPDMIFVQGDTTTVLIGSISAFYLKVKVAHVEAGLRSLDMHSPFPEEMNRVLSSRLANIHFAPTKISYDNLIQEGIQNNVYLTGNTVIDSLFLGLELLQKSSSEQFSQKFKFLESQSRIILITCHRRENFGDGIQNIFMAIKKLAQEFKDVQFVFPVHLNPNVRVPAHEFFRDLSNVYLLDPLTYPELIYLMSKSYFIMTDSGGIQEEAPSLGKPVLVLRDVTERTEGIAAGTTQLVGTSQEKIYCAARILLTSAENYQKMSKVVNPYGDGKASEKIVEIINSYFQRPENKQI